MVDRQLHAGGVTDRRVLAAFDSVPREDFVPESRRAIAYFDDTHSLGPRHAGRFLVAPTVLARLLQLADIDATDHVLDCNAGTGYASAIAAAFAASVIAVEPEPALAALAGANIARLGLANVRLLDGGLEALGRQEFDVILLHGLISGPPEHLFEFLRPGGRLVALVGSGAMGAATVFHRTGLGIETEAGFNASVPAAPPASANADFVF